MPIAHLNGMEFFYVEGAPCLMMHGGLGFDHTSLHPRFDPLSDVMRLVYYDHRANRRSGRPPLETLTFEEIAVLGFSYGGFVALEYALRYPERLKRLILVDTAATFDYREEIEANARRKGATQEQLDALEAEASDEAAFRQQIETCCRCTGAASTPTSENASFRRPY